MNNLKAPLAVLLIGTAAAIALGEPGAIVLIVVIALLGYTINKAGN